MTTREWIAANQLLSGIIFLAIIVGLYYLAQYLINKFSDENKRYIERDVIVEDTIIPVTPVNTFSMNPGRAGHSMGGSVGGVGVGAGAGTGVGAGASAGAGMGAGVASGAKVSAGGGARH